MSPPRSRPTSKASTGAGSTEVRFDEERELYELGAEIDGTWIAFTTIPSSDVQGRAAAIEAAKANEPA